MAKSKSKPRKRRKSLSTKTSNKMAVRKKRRKRSTTALSTRSRRRAVAAPRRRKRKSGMLSDSGSAPTLKQSAVRGGMAFAGGALYGGGTTYFKVANPWAKAGIGFVSAIGLAHFKMRDMSAGVLGALGSDTTKTLFAKVLNDGDLEDFEYVDPRTLSDSGMCDSHGNRIITDRNGVMYSEDQHGTLHEMADEFALSDPTTNMQSVSMLPLMDNFSLSSNPYNLQDNGY